MTDGERATARHAARVRGAVILDHLAPGHPLPVGNGWTLYGGQPAVWCGNCKHLYALDADWAERYLTTKWRQLRAMAASRSNRATADYAARRIRHLAAQLRDAGVSVPKRVRA